MPALLPPAPELHLPRRRPSRPRATSRAGASTSPGFFTSELGVGEAARLLIAGLDAAGIPALPIQGQLVPPSRQDAEFAYAGPTRRAYPINIVCINGDGDRRCSPARRDARSSRAATRSRCGGGRSASPRRTGQPAYEFIDEVWVASQHIYDAIAPTSPVPVVRVTLPVLMPRGRAAHARASWACPRRASCSCTCTTTTRSPPARTRWG